MDVDDFYRDEFRPFIKVGDDKVDFTDHDKVVEVDPKEWEIYKRYIKSINDHKVWLIEDAKREEEESLRKGEEEKRVLEQVMAQIAEM